MGFVETVGRKLADSDAFTVALDSGGIPIVNYGIQLGKSIGLQYNPLVVGLVGLKLLHVEADFGTIVLDLPEGMPTDQEYPLGLARWLLEHSVRRQGFEVWQYDYPWPPQKLESGWVSAIAEVAGCLFLTRIALNWPEHAEEIKRHIAPHLSSLDVPWSSGGVRSDCPLHRGPWYAEYVGRSRNPPWHLNAMMHSLLGLRSINRLCGHEGANAQYQAGLQELLKHVYEFDGAFWSLYDDMGTPALRKYQQIHATLAESLGHVSGGTDLAGLAQKWQREMSLYPASFFAAIVSCLLVHRRFPYLNRA
jgi:hypothetical protein